MTDINFPEIETNFPLPSLSARGKYPFYKMEIGNSFFLKCPPHRRGVLASAASYYGKRHGQKFVVRAVYSEVDFDEVIGERCWRVE